MLALIADKDDFAWADRNDHWQSKSQKPGRYRPKHRRASEPLILCGHGVSLKIDKGALAINNGFTHWPQERESFRFFKGDLRLPPKIIMLDGSGGLSFDVIAWLAEQNTALIRVDYQGDVVSIIGGAGTAQDPERLRWQIDTRADHERRLEFCCDLIADKVCKSITALRTAVPESAARSNAVMTGEAAIRKLARREVRTVNDVLMVEARAAAAYFSAWRGLPIRWKSLKRHPVPESWLIAGSRRTLRDSRSSSNRNATHPVNAMLNYAYGILHSRMQINALAEGYDPRLGIMHESRPDAHAFILDIMERERPAADASVLRFIAANTFTGSDFVIREDGVCRLAPQLARRLAREVSSL